MSSDRLPNDFSNGWIPYTPEPSRDTYANGLGKLSMRRAMYGDMAWGFMTIGPGHFRRAKEEQERLWRLHGFHRAGGLPTNYHVPSVSLQNDEALEPLLEGSIPDIAPPRTTMRPVERPTSSHVLARRLPSQALALESNQVEPPNDQSEPLAQARRGHIATRSLAPYDPVSNYTRNGLRDFEASNRHATPAIHDTQAAEYSATDTQTKYPATHPPRRH